MRQHKQQIGVPDQLQQVLGWPSWSSQKPTKTTKSTKNNNNIIITWANKVTNYLSTQLDYLAE